MKNEQAEILGLRALAYMLAHEDIITAYLRLTGMTAEYLEISAADPAILGSILDYFLHNEKKLIALCRAEDIAPSRIATARQFLPGGEITPDNI